MAGEVRSELVIRLEGGSGGGAAGAAGGGVRGGGMLLSATPVSRRAQALSPMQHAANFQANRQLHFTREIAMEMARDREAAREFEEAMLRRSALADMEVTSARRAQEQFRRNNLLAMVRQRGQADALDGTWAFDRRMSSRARSFARSTIRDATRGAFAGAMASSLMPEGGGLTGSLSRIFGDTVAGATFGGKAGAAVALIWSSIHETRNLLGQLDRDAQLRREEAQRVRDAVESELAAMRSEIELVKETAEKAFNHAVRVAVDRATTHAYRQSRDISFDLVP